MTIQRLLDAYLSAYEYRYDPGTVLLELDCFIKKISCNKDFSDFVARVNCEKNIVFYVPVQNRALLKFLSQRGFQRQGQLERIYVDFSDKEFLELLEEKLKRIHASKLFSKYEFLTCRASEHPGLSFLLGEYLSEHRHTFLDAFGTPERIFEDLADYHYFEGLHGEPLAFNKGIHPSTGREAEITYGRGSFRQNIAMILYSLMEENKMGTRELEINVPYDSVTKILLMLEMESEGKLAVMVAKRKSTARTRARRSP